MKKRFFSSELAYFVGIIGLAFGTALMTRADFGLSMIVAPAYILSVKLSETLSFVTFGMMEYMVQALLLVILSLILKRFRLPYLFSFVTAVFYGFTLDGCLWILSSLPTDLLLTRIILYVVGFLTCTFAIACVFHTYIPGEAYEVFVKEICDVKGKPIGTFKTKFDLTFCLIAVVLSFVFFGWFRFVGVNIGTIVCTLFNGKLIALWGQFLDHHFIFRDSMPFRKYLD